MAGGTMQFTPSSARTSAKSMLTNSQNIQKQVSNLQNTMDSLTWWKGDSVEKFKKQFQNIKKDLEKTYKCVEGISTQLNDMASNYEKMEAEISGQIKA